MLVFIFHNSYSLSLSLHRLQKLPGINSGIPCSCGSDIDDDVDDDSNFAMEDDDDEDENSPPKGFSSVLKNEIDI